MYLDTSKLTGKQRTELVNELEKQHFYVQHLFLEDPTRLLVEAEIRNRLEAEQAAEKAKTVSSGRAVTVSHTRPATGRADTHYCYGDAITGRPIIEANVLDWPRNQDELEWLRDYLPSYIGPGGVINLQYSTAKHETADVEETTKEG